MPTTIQPQSFVLLLLALRESFTAPSFGNFQCLVAGWIHCLGRHTITAVALASGAVGQRHLSVFHRFFWRAQWSLDAVGQVLFTLALRSIPADQPLVLLGDDTLAYTSGKGVSLAAMHHDPLLSTAHHPASASVISGWGASALGLPAAGTAAGLRPADPGAPVYQQHARRPGQRSLPNHPGPSPAGGHRGA